MNYFSVLYKMPTAGLEEWMKIPEEKRKAEEDALKAEWNTWLKEHSSVKNTIGLGKTKQVSAEGITDTKNGLMLSSYVEGESTESVAELFRNHPHLKIPGATIEIMETSPLTVE